MKSDEVWIVDDDRSIRWVMDKALTSAGIKHKTFSSAFDVRKQLSISYPAAVITDIRMPDEDGLSLLDYFLEKVPNTPVIIMTAHADLDAAISSYSRGAFEYLPKPFDLDEAIHLISRALERHKESINEIKEDAERQNFPQIIGKAPSMQNIFRAIGRLRNADITVIINGSSGTGKELVAKALHANSARANKRFVALNMAAIPNDLIESELFGHEKGAFTSAATSRQGWFEQADGGTLFLDEIADMPFEMQTRLLRVLSEGQFYRVGGLKPLYVNVRIIAATHQNLATSVENGKFREDLYHRLNVIRITLPSLCDRREDISMLSQHFLARASSELKIEQKILSDESKQIFFNYGWPGNVRQLENTCKWLSVMAPNRTIMASDLPPDIFDSKIESSQIDEQWTESLKNCVNSMLNSKQSNLIDVLGRKFERTLLATALAHTGGKKTEAAQLLGWGRNTLTRKLREL